MPTYAIITRAKDVLVIRTIGIRETGFLFATVADAQAWIDGIGR
jgi:hypothetical protein